MGAGDARMAAFIERNFQPHDARVGAIVAFLGSAYQGSVQHCANVGVIQDAMRFALHRGIRDEVSGEAGEPARVLESCDLS
jgi:hypothetical protein